MNFIKLFLPFVFAVFSGFLIKAQENTTLYYYVGATNIDTAQNKILYLSKIEKLTFFGSFSFMDYNAIPKRIDGQYINYLGEFQKRKKQLSYKFTTYYLSSNKTEIKVRIKKDIKRYRGNGYRVIRVRKFLYVHFQSAVDF